MTNPPTVPGDDPSGTLPSGTEVSPDGAGPEGASEDPNVVGAVEVLTGEEVKPADRRRALGQLAAGLRRLGFKDMLRPKAAMAWVTDAIVDVAPRIPLRDLATLRAQHAGMTDAQIAQRLIRNAARTTASIGAVGGGVATIEWVAAPTLLTAPALLAAETVAVVAIEIKLIGELQELYGQPVPSGSGKAISLLQAWAGRRGVNLLVPGRGFAAVLGTAARHELRDRIIRRFGRNLTALGPFFTGAAVAAILNRRATLKLAQEVQADLAKRIPKQITRGG